MKLVTIFFIYMIIIGCSSCIESIDEKLSYYDWIKSVSNTVNNQDKLINFQKENLIEISKNIPESSFNEMKDLLLQNAKDKKIDGEYFLLKISEGEVVLASLYYSIKMEGRYLLAYMDVYEENKKAVKLNKSNLYIKQLISLEPLNVNALSNELFILTTVKNKKVVSIIGNNNQIQE